MAKKVWTQANLEAQHKAAAKVLAARRGIPLSKLLEQLIVRECRKELRKDGA